MNLQQIRAASERYRLIVILSVLSSCAAPATHFEPLSPALLRGEELTQQRLVVDWQLHQLRRLENVGHPLLVAASIECGKMSSPRSGLMMFTATDFGDDLAEAAFANGFTDTLVIVNVASRSNAESAGLREGDRVTALYGQAAPRGKTARREVLSELQRRAPSEGIALTIMRADSSRGTGGGSPHSFSYRPELACPFGLLLQRDDNVNAYADGNSVTVTSAMLRFVEGDDELSTVVGHEIAHNAMKHSNGTTRNSTLGAVLGAIVDIAAASRGVNTNASYSRLGAKAGADAFSQDFEREADYVGAYFQASAGFQISSSTNFWRRMSRENPANILYAGTHPSNAERFLRLDATVSEIAAKLARAAPLRREFRAPAPTFAGNNTAPPRRPYQIARARETLPPPVSTPLGLAAASRPIAMDSGRAMVSSEPVLSRRDRARAAETAPGTTVRLAGAPLVMRLDQRERAFEWAFGPPSARDGLTIEQVVVKARRSYEEGVQAREVSWGARARDFLYEATQLDGSVALYQAALGELLLRQGFRAEAQAVLSAAILLNPENSDYRRLLAEARK